jgi:hypothetical protein
MGEDQRAQRDDDTFNVASVMAAARGRLIAARATTAPTFTDDAGGHPEPAANQMWRARWEKTATAVLLLAAPHADRFQVAAITFDPDLADSNAAVVPANGTTLGIPAVIWLGVERTIPTATLDAHLGDITTLAPPRPAKTGELPQFQTSPHRVLDDGVMRARVQDDLDALSAATWVLETGGDPTELLQGIKNSQVAEALGLSTAEALQVKRGQRPLQPGEAAKLSALTGHPVEKLLGAANPLPATVIELFNTPAVRKRVIDLAKARGADELSMRREAAYGVVAAAARTTGQSPEAQRTAWRMRIDQYFETRIPSDD